MTSGKPLSAREKAFIELWADEKFPTVIARHLGAYYAEDNGGSRSTQTVRNYIRDLKAREQKKQKPNRTQKPAPAS